MSLLDPKKKKTVNEGINIVRTTPGAYLIDIRSREDFRKGHVPDAVNIPYNRMDLAEHRFRDKNALLYVCGSYFHKPDKSVRELKKMGFTNVHSCGYMEEHNVKPMG